MLVGAGVVTFSTFWCICSGVTNIGFKVTVMFDPAIVADPPFRASKLVV